MVTRWKILILVLVLLAGLSSPAGAEPILLEKNDQGAFYVIDRVFEKQGDCRVVAALLVRRQARKTDYGLVKAVTRVLRVCCKAETYQLVSYRFVGPGGEVVFTRRVPGAEARVVRADPGGLMYRLIKKVCAPGFGED